MAKTYPRVREDLEELDFKLVGVLYSISVQSIENYEYICRIGARRQNIQNYVSDQASRRLSKREINLS